MHTLGRSPKKSNTKNLLHFGWDVEKGKIDSKALEGVSAIIHLAGAGVADKAWTSARKKEIIDSRVVSANLLFSHLQKNKHTIKTFISASAVGIYGDQADKELKETALKGEGFLADVCEKWEQAAIQFSSLGIREARARIGIVLSKDGGALPELTQSLPFGIAPYFAKKNLYYPWIHIDDVVGIFSYLLQEEKCERVFKFSDPATYSCADLERNLLFVGSYDRSVKAIDLKTGEVDRSFIASREAIKCLLIHENCLYVAGDD